VFGLGRIQTALIGLTFCFGLAATFVFWQRQDAVSDFKQSLDAQRGDQINKAREIENEIRSISDGELVDCLLGRGC